MKHTKGSAVALLGALSIAALLRLYGITYAPTAPLARPDEEIFTGRAFQLFDSSHAREIFETGWPEGYFRLDKIVLGVESATLDAWYHRPVNLACLYALNPGAVERWVRLASVLADLASCLLVAATVMLLATSEASARTGAVFGVLAFGCNYLAARDGHFGVSDAVLTFFCTLCLYFSVRAVRTGPFFLPFAAAAAGAGFGVKYSAFALAGPCLVAGIVCLVHFFPRARWRTTVLALLSFPAAIGALVLISPGVIGNVKPFIAGVVGHEYRYADSARIHLMDKSPAYVLLPGWRFHLFTNLPIAFGWIGLVLAFVGIAIALSRRPREGIVIAASTLAALAMLVPIKTLFVRYAAPMLPGLTVGLSITLAAIWERAQPIPRRPWRLVIALGVAGLALVPPVVTTLQFDALMAQPDTRDLASRWLLQRGGGPAIAQGFYGEPRLLDPSLARACAATVPDELNPGLPISPPGTKDWRSDVGAGRSKWGDIAIDAVSHSFHTENIAKARYVFDGRGRLPCGRDGWDPNPTLDPKCYVLRDTIEPGKLRCDSVMDLFDAFYLPYGGFGGQVLPGPRINIYENMCRRPSQREPD